MITEGKDRREIYVALITDPKTAGTFKKYSFKEFENRLLNDEKAASMVAERMVQKGIAQDVKSFYDNYMTLPATKAQPAPQPSQPPAVSLAPPQRQSIEQQAAGQATGFVPPMQAMPMQATGQPQTGQIIELTGEPQTGEFRAEIVNGKKVYMPQGITAGGEEFIDEGTDVSKDPTGQYQSTGVLIDDRGQTLNEELQNIVTGTPKDKQGLAYQNAQNVKNDAKSTWQRLKETGSGLLTSAKTQADAAMAFLDTILMPMSFVPGASKPVSEGGFGGETNISKNYKKEFIRTALDGEKELNNKIQELGLQTDIVDAVKSGRGSDIIQAINHNIGQMAYQVPLSISTFGASSFAMEGAEAYKGIVDAQAKELGITADELIERGLDKQALGIGVGAISGAVDYLGAKSLASFINAGGAYEQLAKAIASKLPKKYGTGFLTRAAVASNAEGFQESIQEGVKLGGERIASGKWDPNALNRLGKSYANAAVGAGGTYVGGRTVNAALNPSESITLNTFNNAPVIGQAPQQGGFDAVILADQINQGKKVDIQSALAADAYLDSEIQRQGENVSPELLEHKKTISEFIDKENEFAPRRQARKDVLPDGSVLYFVGSEAEVPEEFKDRAKPSTSTRDGKPVGSFSFTLTPEEDAAYQQGVPPPSGATQTTYETVTPEELQAFQQGQIDPERAAAIADDVALIQSGQMDINSIEDPNYRLMVESAMGVGQQEQQGGAAELSQINDRILTIEAAGQEGKVEGEPGEYAALKKRKAELESQVKTEEPKVKTQEEKSTEWDSEVESSDPKRINDWLLNNAEEGDRFLHDDGQYFQVTRVNTRKNGKKYVEMEIVDPEIEGILGVHIIEETESGSKESTKFSQSKTPSFKYVFTDKDGNRQIATAKYVGNQSNATPQSETIVADQAAQNMGTAVNQPLETGAAAVEVGESGRPVVEVEGDQVVEEEKPVEGYDFAKMFEPLTKEEQEKIDKENLQDEANEKQRLFDKAGFDKSWAKDYDEAKTKLIDQYNKAKEKKEKAQAKVIKKSGGKTVFVGDEVGGVNVSVDRINEKNRLQDIAIAEKDMAEAVKDLAKLGVKEADLLPSQKNVKSSEKAVVKPKEQNFTQFAKENGYPDDYDTSFQAQLLGSRGLEGQRQSNRSIKEQDAALQEMQNKKAEGKKAYEQAILDGKVIDPDGKLTREGILKRDYDFNKKELESKIANAESGIKRIEGLGKMAHLDNGRLKKGYQGAVDDYNETIAKHKESLDKLKAEYEQSLKETTQAEAKAGNVVEGSGGAGGGKSILNSDVDLKGEVKPDWMHIDNEEKVIPISELSERDMPKSMGGMSISDALKNIENGKPTKSEGAIEVLRNVGGKYLIRDGYHRVANAIKSGVNEIKGVVKNTESVKSAIKNNKYQKAIEEGRMTATDAKKIIESAGLDVPKDITEQSLKETPQAEAEKTSPLAPFQTKDKEGQAARAALKESVGPKEFKRLENIAKNGEKILRDLESRGVLKIDCP